MDSVELVKASKMHLYVVFSEGVLGISAAASILCNKTDLPGTVAAGTAWGQLFCFILFYFYNLMATYKIQKRCHRDSP